MVESQNLSATSSISLNNEEIPVRGVYDRATNTFFVIRSEHLYQNLRNMLQRFQENGEEDRDEDMDK